MNGQDNVDAILLKPWAMDISVTAADTKGGASYGTNDRRRGWKPRVDILVRFNSTTLE